MAIAWLVFRENVDRRLLLGALAILAGAVLVSCSGQGVGIDAGAGLIAAACLAWGIHNNLTRKVSAANPVVTAIVKGLIAGFVNTAIAFSLGAAVPALPPIGAAALVGFLGVGVSLVLFVLALRHLGTARTGAYFSLAPFIGAVIAVPLLHETPQLLGAGVLMAFGLWMHLAERHDHEHSHDVLEHDHTHVHDEHHRHVHDRPIRSRTPTGTATNRCGTGTPTTRISIIDTATGDHPNRHGHAMRLR